MAHPFHKTTRRLPRGRWKVRRQFDVRARRKATQWVRELNLSRVALGTPLEDGYRLEILGSWALERRGDRLDLFTRCLKTGTWQSMDDWPDDDCVNLRLETRTAPSLTVLVEHTLGELLRHQRGHFRPFNARESAPYPDRLAFQQWRAFQKRHTARGASVDKAAQINGGKALVGHLWKDILGLDLLGLCRRTWPDGQSMAKAITAFQHREQLLQHRTAFPHLMPLCRSIPPQQWGHPMWGQVSTWTTRRLNFPALTPNLADLWVQAPHGVVDKAMDEPELLPIFLEAWANTGLGWQSPARARMAFDLMDSSITPCFLGPRKTPLSIKQWTALFLLTEQFTPVTRGLGLSPKARSNMLFEHRQLAQQAHDMLAKNTWTPENPWEVLEGHPWKRLWEKQRMTEEIGGDIARTGARKARL